MMPFFPRFPSSHLLTLPRTTTATTTTITTTTTATATVTTRLFSTAASPLRTHKSSPSTFQFHGLGTRSYSFRRSGGVRGLISKRGFGLNSSSGLLHLPTRRAPPSQKNIIRAGLFSSILGAFSTTSAATNTKTKTAQEAGAEAEAMSSTSTTYPVSKSEQEWRAVLSPEQFRILRQQGTEAPRSGKYDKHHAPAGVYTCVGCNTPLYKATTKFKSGCGWPAFYENLPGKVVRKEDRTRGMSRTEIVCASCGGHLGHVFKGEGYDTPTDERHCVNSVSLSFVDEEEGEAKTESARV